MASRGPIGVVGATGVLGRQVLAVLHARDVSADEVRVFSTTEEALEEVDYGEDTLGLEAPAPEALRGLSGAVLAVPAPAAKELAVTLQRQGTWVVDASGAFRLDTQVPLVAPQVNDGVLDRAFPGRVVSVAGAAAQASLLVLEPLRAAFGLVLADITSLHGAAALGEAGVRTLASQTGNLMNGKEPEVEVFPHRLAFNLIPEVGEFDGPLSGAERATLVELARVWADAPVALTTTAIQVPTYHALMLVLSVHLARPVDPDGVRAAYKDAPGVKVLDDVENHVYPMPMLVTDDVAVHVGRIRARTERVQLVAAADPATLVADRAVQVILRLRER